MCLCVCGWVFFSVVLLVGVIGISVVGRLGGGRLVYFFGFYCLWCFGVSLAVWWCCGGLFYCLSVGGY